MAAEVAVVSFLAGAAVGDDEISTVVDSQTAAADLKPMEPGALEFASIYPLWRREPNLTGHGVNIAAVCASQSYVNLHPQNDYRFNMNHNSLYDADVHFTDGTDGRLGTSSHATAIAGILLGLDDAGHYEKGGDFYYRGTCPDATVTVHEFWRFVMHHLYGHREFEADLVTLSLGEMFETWWTRAIERMAAQKDTLVISSIGNGSDVLTPKPLYPGAGSNVLGVGVVDSVYDSSGTADLRKFGQVQSAHSSIGPTGDWRCKPDMVAPGTALVPRANRGTGYDVVENWSSLSAPMVCGAAALLLEKANSDETLKTAMDGGRSLVLKSLLMNSARKLPYWHKGEAPSEDDHEMPLDLLQGSGILDGMEAFNQLTAGPGKPGVVNPTGWDNRLLEKDGWGYEYAFTVTEPNRVITATLCWNRAYAPDYPYPRQPEMDGDFRLELWAVDANDVSRETLLDYSDSVNDNVEHLYWACEPNVVNYALRVRFNETSLPSVGQRFGLAWSVGADRQADNPWWYDLNGDSVIDAVDHLAFMMFDQGMIEKMEPAMIETSLKLTPERIALLSRHWTQWKSRLDRYTLELSEALASEN
jgi:hypothetical protein